MTEPFWTAQDGEKQRFFHLVANGYALFTAKTDDAFRCNDQADAEELCDVLKETDPDGDWRAVNLSEASEMH